MKKIKFLLFIFLLLMPFYVEAFSPTSTSCYLDDVAESGYTFDQTSCKELTITSTADLAFLKEQTTQFDSVILAEGSFYDMSFLKNSVVENLIVYDSFVDFRGYYGNVKNIEFNRGTIADSDFSGLARNGSDFETISFVNSYADDFSTFPVSMVKNSFSISKHKNPRPDMSSFVDYTGESLAIVGVGYSLDAEIVEALEINGVEVTGVDTSVIESDREIAQEWFDELEIDYFDLEGVYEKIAIEVTNRITSTSTISTDALHNYVNGYGDPYVYSIMTALYLRGIGIEATTVSIEHTGVNSTQYYYITAFLTEDGWRYMDTYYLDDTGLIEDVKNGSGSPYLNFIIQGEGVGLEYSFEEHFPENFNIPDYVVIKSDDNIVDIKLLSDLTDLPLPFKEGYQFWGWFFDAEFKDPVETAADLLPGDMIYARWGVGNPPTNTDEPEDDTDLPFVPDDETPPQNNVDDPNAIKPPNTGSFAIPFILLLTLVLIFIMRINSKMFKRVFRI